MKNKTFIFSFMFSVTLFTQAQNSKFVSKINLVGVGYGMEYFFSPGFSWHNETGVSYWEKLNENIQHDNSYQGITFLNPYFSSSIRYYFISLHPTQHGKSDIGWRISASYTGLFSQESVFKFSGKNRHQAGVFAGTSIYFPKKLYFELELGPGYLVDPFKGNRFDLLGNMGFGFRF